MACSNSLLFFGGIVAGRSVPRDKPGYVVVQFIVLLLMILLVSVLETLPLPSPSSLANYQAYCTEKFAAHWCRLHATARFLEQDHFDPFVKLANATLECRLSKQKCRSDRRKLP